jgi:hypothetical protein
MSLAETIIRALGINPADAQAAVNSVVTDANRVKTEVLAAKGGFQAAIAHFNTRLDRIEGKIDLIIKEQSLNREFSHAPNGKDISP